MHHITNEYLTIIIKMRYIFNSDLKEVNECALVILMSSMQSEILVEQMNIQGTVGMCMNKIMKKEVTILQVMYNFIRLTSLFSLLFLHVIVLGHM